MKVGKLYFAMVDASDVFDQDVHNVEDLQVFDLKISQSEGEFSRAQLEIPNPGTGLLSSTRKQYIFISCDFNGDVIPLFAGRVVGFPTDLTQETITVEYVAQPTDWVDDQQAFLDTLKVAPFYNVLFSEVDKRDDPIEILAARNSLIHWNRVPGGTISLSDIVEGSTTINIDGDYIFDSLKTNVGNPPLKTVQCTVEVQWLQNGTGTVNVGDGIKAEFVNTGGAPTPRINTLTPKSFEAAWQGAQIPAGYIIKQSSLNPIIKGVPAAYLKSAFATVSSEFFPTRDGGVGFVSRSTYVPRVWYDGILKLTAFYTQKRHEILSFSLSSVTQQFSLSSDSVENISFKLQDPTAAANLSILDSKEPTFFYDKITHILTAYGQDVVENALLRARSRLVKAARVIETSFVAPISSLEILNITCDDSIHIEDERLPGGKLRGKVIGYNLNFSSNGQNVEITIGSLIGTGVDTSGVGTTLQPYTYDNEDTISIDPTMESSVIYSLGTVPSPTIPIDVDALETNEFYCVTNTSISNGGNDQNIAFPSQTRPDDYLNDNGTSTAVDLRSMNPQGELLLEFSLDTELLTLPQHVDLEAS